MSNIAKYVLVLIVLVSVHETCFSKTDIEDTQLCASVLPKYDITYTETPINYRLDKRARDLRTEFDANEYTLGYFHSNLNIEKQIFFTTFTDNKNKCTELIGLELNLSFQPNIFITKEAQSFRCTFERTIKHEHTHYKIEKTAFLTLLQKIDSMVKKHFDDFNKKNYKNKDKEMDIRIKNLIDDINEFLELQTKLQHSILDTEENYQNESKVCDNKENTMLDRLFELDQ